MNRFYYSSSNTSIFFEYLESHLIHPILDKTVKSYFIKIYELKTRNKTRAHIYIIFMMQKRSAHKTHSTTKDKRRETKQARIPRKENKT